MATILFDNISTDAWMCESSVANRELLVCMLNIHRKMVFCDHLLQDDLNELLSDQVLSREHLCSSEGLSLRVILSASTLYDLTDQQMISRNCKINAIG